MKIIILQSPELCQTTMYLTCHHRMLIWHIFIGSEKQGTTYTYTITSHTIGWQCCDYNFFCNSVHKADHNMVSPRTLGNLENLRETSHPMCPDLIRFQTRSHLMWSCSACVFYTPCEASGWLFSQRSSHSTTNPLLNRHKSYSRWGLQCWLQESHLGRSNWGWFSSRFW